VPSERPPLSASLDAGEFRRWYWLKEELVEFAQQEGLSAAGDKPKLADRIALFLGGLDPKLAAAATKTIRQTISNRLPEPLTSKTELGSKQASSQQLRTFFVEAIGPRFSYDIHMRTFLASDRTKTLGEVVAHWHATRNTVKPETLPQLELVRFTKAWHLANPTGTQLQCRAAWKRYKALPVDQRESIEPFNS
jgi:SAP domain-containing new25/Domain of unknown function (DUF6434)